MNTFRTVSRVLVVTAVALVSNASATFDVTKLRSNLNNAGKKGSKLLIDNKYVIMSSFASKYVKGDLNKASIEKIGYMFDKADAVKDKDIEPADLLMHLGANYGIRKGGQQLEKIGFTVDAAAKKCETLMPEGMIRDTVNPAVRTVVETATEPEVLTLLALHYVLPAIIGMFAGGSTANNT